MKFNEKEIAEACGAEVLKNIGDDVSFGISTDTRTIKEGEIYLPLKGATFDGENFIQQALESGAAGYFTTSDKVFDGAKVVFKVENTLTAYLLLALSKTTVMWLVRFKIRKALPCALGITLLRVGPSSA